MPSERRTFFLRQTGAELVIAPLIHLGCSLTVRSYIIKGEVGYYAGYEVGVHEKDALAVRFLEAVEAAYKDTRGPAD